MFPVWISYIWSSSEHLAPCYYAVMSSVFSVWTPRRTELSTSRPRMQSLHGNIFLMVSWKFKFCISHLHIWYIWVCFYRKYEVQVQIIFDLWCLILSTHFAQWLSFQWWIIGPFWNNQLGGCISEQFFLSHWFMCLSLGQNHTELLSQVPPFLLCLAWVPSLVSGQKSEHLVNLCTFCSIVISEFEIKEQTKNQGHQTESETETRISFTFFWERKLCSLKVTVLGPSGHILCLCDSL